MGCGAPGVGGMSQHSWPSSSAVRHPDGEGDGAGCWGCAGSRQAPATPVGVAPGAPCVAVVGVEEEKEKEKRREKEKETALVPRPDRVSVCRQSRLHVKVWRAWFRRSHLSRSGGREQLRVRFRVRVRLRL